MHPDDLFTHGDRVRVIARGDEWFGHEGTVSSFEPPIPELRSDRRARRGRHATLFQGRPARDDLDGARPATRARFARQLACAVFVDWAVHASRYGLTSRQAIRLRELSDGSSKGNRRNPRDLQFRLDVSRRPTPMPADRAPALRPRRGSRATPEPPPSVVTSRDWRRACRANDTTAAGGLPRGPAEAPGVELPWSLG